MKSDIAIHSDKFPLISAHAHKTDTAREEVGGAANTELMDQMGMRDCPGPLMQMRHIVAQIEGIDEALFHNLDLRKKSKLKIAKMKIEIAAIKRDMVRSKVKIIGALKRKEGFLRQYLQLEEKYGVLSEEIYAQNELKEQIMRCFSNALNHVYEHGRPTAGFYIYWDQLDVGSRYEFLSEITSFVFRQTEMGQIMTPRTRKEEREFLTRMAEKYGVGRNNG